MTPATPLLIALAVTALLHFAPWRHVDRFLAIVALLLCGVFGGAALLPIVSAEGRASRMLGHYAALDRALVAAGFPPTSDWWWETVKSFYLSGRRQLVLRVGRRGGKSSTLMRVAVVEGVFGEHRITPGDVGIVGIVSVSRDEAAQRLRMVRAILDALKVRYRERGETIELTDRPIVFKVFTASIAGVVGGTWICAILDEGARWRDNDTGSNPAKEVLASLRPTLATMPHAKIFFSSSPLSTLDAHAAAFDEGDDDFQIVAWAPTWIANPTISENDTRKLEKDERIRLREYGAIPSSAVAAAFDPDLIERGFRPPPRGRWSRPSIVVDLSSGRGDATTWARATWMTPAFDTSDAWTELLPDGSGALSAKSDAFGRALPSPETAWKYRPKLVIQKLRAIEGKFFGKIGLDDIAARIAADFFASNASRVFADQREELGFESALRRQRITRFVPVAWSNPVKVEAVTRLRRLLAEGHIIFDFADDADEQAEKEKLRRELVTFEEKVLPSGTITFNARSGRHDDRVALLITLLGAETAARIARESGKDVPGSPNQSHGSPRILRDLDARTR